MQSGMMSNYRCDHSSFSIYIFVLLQSSFHFLVLFKSSKSNISREGLNCSMLGWIHTWWIFAKKWNVCQDSSLAPLRVSFYLQRTKWSSSIPEVCLCAYSIYTPVFFIRIIFKFEPHLFILLKNNFSLHKNWQFEPMILISWFL